MINSCFRQKASGTESESQSNLNEAELNILNDKECVQLGTYKDILTNQLLTVIYFNLVKENRVFKISIKLLLR